jgi:2-polyprenyl-6-methoxyphenol hydroxylase-like FAD-dependent oxidoreductase
LRRVGFLRIAIVGAGLAGLASAAAFSRSGHEVAVFEQADGLRASGLAINLWSNATSLLPAFGLPATRLPGEPFSRMVFRASGRNVAIVPLPAQGLAHVTVERAELLSALAAVLPANAIHYGTRRADARALAADHDLVVAADGTNSALRSAVAGPVRKRWSWLVWQASVTAEVPQLLPDACANVVRPGFFSGIFRLPDGRITWFAEQPGRGPGEGQQLLLELTCDQDGLLRAVAQATAADQWTEWRAEDMWPPRMLHRGNIVLVGDAAHAMLPTIGQGACQALEDAAVLVSAIAAEQSLDQALRRYTAIRVPRLRKIVALARVSALGRRPPPASRLMPATASARFMARTGGPVLRRMSRPVIAVPEP